MARVFAVMEQGLIEAGRGRDTKLIGARIYPRLQIWLRALAQCRGTRLIEARKLSRYIGFILHVVARIRVHILVGFVLGAGFCKNRDKQLTHIVRVSRSL